MKNKIQIELKMVNGKLVATRKKEKCLPSMNDVKNSMWGKGKHSTRK